MWDIRQSLAYPWRLVHDPDEVAFQRMFGPWAIVRPEQVPEVLGDFDRPW